MASYSMSRMEREAVGRREAERCKTEGHPFSRLAWQPGDYDIPDQRICTRCWKVLTTRPHRTEREC
jgi:hypothetical protein